MSVMWAPARLGVVGYCSAQDARGDVRVDVGATPASRRAAGWPGRQAGALTRRVQARTVIGSSKGETRSARGYDVFLAGGTTVALAYRASPP